MFETATFESAGAIRTRSRSWMLATLTLNSGILLTLVLLPLIYPSALSPRTFIDPIFTPPRPPAAISQSTARTAASSSSSVQMVTLPTLSASRPSQLGNIRSTGPTLPGSCLDCNGDITGGTGIPGGDPLASTLPSTPAPHVVKPKGPITISTGVANGMLIPHPSPSYPIIARNARIEGTVILQATISKSGAIEGLRVLSGHPMLRQAAIDAVQNWRYRPYLLNGEPVEVETTINVIFSLGQ